jgi:hypothetical protein
MLGYLVLYISMVAVDGLSVRRQGYRVEGAGIGDNAATD